MEYMYIITSCLPVNGAERYLINGENLVMAGIVSNSIVISQ